MAIRLYLSALTLVFFLLAWFDRGVGVLEAIVVVCALVYLILDTRERLQLVKTDLQLLEQLEKESFRSLVLKLTHERHPG